MAAAQGNPLETELNTYRAIQKEIGKVQGNISTAQTQILENEMVLKVCIPLSRYGLLKGRGRRVPTRGRRECLHRASLASSQELELLEEDSSVFKLIGPVLVKQELVEVKNNVTKRVEFIKNDM